ncbi:MAG: Hsp33 family molecular chaperone [Rhizobiales bacterium]|nr:Hsp33 family molecular chaperone [Hyphomicrobiales bacterium]MBA67480.1 Hsp33 family molecular chaperone [Hyphomicrobiales bacterium]
MTDNNLNLGDIGFAGDDHVVPFAVEGLDVRGRAVQLGPMLDTILGRHDYPEPVARLLAELITLTVLLGTSLKFEGKLIAQTKGDGPVDFIVADFKTPGDVRAYARFDEDRLNAAIEAGETTPQALLGKGILAFTIDQGPMMQRYQGIVEMDGGSLSEMAETYFRQSEQIPTALRMAVGELYRADADGHKTQSWRAGGMVIQFLPEAPERMRQPDLPGGDVPDDVDLPERGEDDAWTEARALAETIAADELTDPDVGSERLLFRLFNEHGVRVFPPSAVEDKCSCSREKLAEVFNGFSAEEIRESVQDGHISVVCEFCSTAYLFEPKEFGVE